MALSANTTWEVRPLGNDTNGGGFVAGASGTDWSVQDAAQYAVTDAVGNATTSITSATAAFGVDVIGNICYFDGAWYQITARPSVTEITVDRATTTGAGLTLNIGGGLASPGRAAGVMVAQNWVFVKAGTYAISASPNVSGGRVQDVAGGSDAQHTAFIGYDSTRTIHNTDASRPLLQVASASVTIFRSVGSFIAVHNFDLEYTGAGKSGTGIQLGDRRSRAVRCRVANCEVGFNLVWSSGATTIGCVANSCATGFLNGGRHIACAAIHCTSAGFRTQFGEFFWGCLGADNGAEGFGWLGGANPSISNCTAANNIGAGFLFAGSGGLIAMMNCIAYGNGGYGLHVTSGGVDHVQSLGAGANTSGRSNSVAADRDAGAITLTADPFTDAAGGDFSLNDAAGGGALLKGTGWPQTLPVV